MKIITRISVICTLLLLGISTAKAQNRPAPGSIGISASIQTNQTNLKVPIWASENLVIAPVFGLTHQSDSFTSLNLGVNPRLYQDLGDNFASYIGAQGILQRTSPEFGPEDTDFLIGAAGGGEFFPDEHFSIGIEGQLNFLLNDNGDDSISTGTAITASYYF